MTAINEPNQLKYFPRNIGKSYQQFQVFITACRKGEDAVYRMTEGDMCSPARVKHLIELERLKSARETRLSIRTALRRMYGGSGYGTDNDHEIAKLDTRIQAIERSEG